jgi:hypothetical protein
VIGHFNLLEPGEVDQPLLAGRIAEEPERMSPALGIGGHRGGFGVTVAA